LQIKYSVNISIEINMRAQSPVKIR